jgi:hypothetical protein
LVLKSSNKLYKYNFEMKLKYIITLIVAALTGCHHDINDLPVFKACKLVEINNFNSNGTRTASTKYEYDKLGNLITATTEQYATSSTVGGFQILIYQYGSDNYLQTRTLSVSGFNLTSPYSVTLGYSYFVKNGLKLLNSIAQIAQTGGVTTSGITYTYPPNDVLPTSSVGGTNNTLVQTYSNGLTTSYVQNDNPNAKYTLSNGRIVQSTIGTVSRRYTYGSKGQLFNSIEYSATTNQTVFTEYTYDDQLTPTQTQLNLKGHPIIAAIYGENTNNIISQQIRSFRGNGLDGTVLSQQLNTYIYTYNTKRLPIARQVNNSFSDIRYTYSYCD